MTAYKFRKPLMADASAVAELINHFARGHIREFTIGGSKGRTIRYAALPVLWEKMVNTRSLAASKSAQKKGIGHKLVEYCLQDARMLGIPRGLKLTHNFDFCRRFGFRECRL